MTDRLELNSQLAIRSTDIAIIGLSCRFPGAPNPAVFWQNLRNGVESITFFADAELDVADPALLTNPHYVKAGAILPDVDLFDAAFFGINSKEAELMDPQQRLFLECAWEAFEDAGYDAERFDGLVGVYAGGGMNTYLINNVHPAYDFSPHRTFLESMNDLQVRLSNDSGGIAMRTSYKFNLKGPSVNVQTTCSTALVAVHTACQSLLAGECDMALAGCISIRVPNKAGYLYQEDMILSPDGHCRTFDAQAQGTVFGDGVGVVVLKLLKQAIADGDTIHAVIKGSAINNDGALKVGYSAPSIQGQRAVISEALAIAEVDAATITYLEAHGTATALGDPVEVTALTQAYREDTQATAYCAIGSVKTNIGHLVETAGMAGLLKTVLALKHQLLPPSLHFRTPNPRIDFVNTPFYVNTKLTAWPQRETTPRRAGVSAFGMGGTNAHLILEEAPRLVAPSNAIERPYHLFTLSARTENALYDLAERYCAYLANQPAAALADICFTANTGRRHFAHRLAVVVQSTAHLHTELTAFVAARHSARSSSAVIQGQAKPQTSSASGIAFLFTGQGAQYVGMGRQLYETQPLFREVIEQCDTILSAEWGESLLAILYPEKERGRPDDKKIRSEGDGQAAEASSPNPKSQIDDTIYTQPLLFALEYALAQLWLAWGITPDVVLGHSLGEYVAACLANVLSLEDALHLVAARGRLMQATAEGVMVAVMANEAHVLAIIAANAPPNTVTIAAVNGPANVVIAGEAQAVAAVCCALEQQAIKTRKLNVSHAFHSPLMTPILAEFEAVARPMTYAQPRLPLITNKTGQVATLEITTPAYWVQHIRQPVRFAESLATLRQFEITTLLEIGPMPTLLGMARSVEQESNHSYPAWTMAPSLRAGQADWLTLLTSLGQLYVQGAAIDWVAFDQPYQRSRVSLPTYPFQRQRYWIEAPKPLLGAHQANGVAKRLITNAPLSSHPLLGQRLPVAGTKELHFTAELSPGALAWLADHQVFATTVMPGTAYAELALAAGRIVFGGTAFTLQDLQILRAFSFPANAPQTGQTVLKPEGEHAYRFEFYSLAPDNGAPAPFPTWQLHATALLQAQATDQPVPHALDSLAAVRAACQTAVSVATLYQRIDQQGIVYGPSYRTMQQVWQQTATQGQGVGDLALALIELPPALRQEQSHYDLHPALLDAAFQVIELFSQADPLEKTFVPVEIEHLTCYARPGAQVWSAVQLREPAPATHTTAHPDQMVADFRLFNTDGTLVADILGFHMKNVNRTVMLDQEPTNLPQTEEPTNQQDWLYQVIWRQQDAPTGAQLPAVSTQATGRHWLILADQTGLGLLVQSRLHELGDTTTTLFHPTPATELDQLIAALPTNLYGVLHLWSLDAPVSDGWQHEIAGAPAAGAVDLDLAAHLGCESTLDLVQALNRRLTPLPRLWLVTRGAQPVLATDHLAGLYQSPLWGMGKVIGLEHPDTQLVCIDLAPEQAPTGTEAKALIQEMLAPVPEDQVAYRQQARYVARLARYTQGQATRSTLSLPTDRPFALTTRERGALDELTVVPIMRRQPNAQEVEIRVYAAGLNFQDVLNALAMYPGNPPFGLECAGEVVAVGEGVTNFAIGDPVIAYASGSLGAYVTVNAQFVVPKPPNLSFIEAATIPAVFLTAYYSLYMSANIAPGQRVLVHAAAGGVGLAACQLAQMAGAEVLGTASPAKWSILHEQGVQHVMNSRTPNFVHPVLDKTSGQGVNIVLNSLTGEEFISQSLATLAPQGRFLELSKRGIWSAEQMQRSRPDVLYNLVDLDQVAQTQPALIQSMLQQLVARFAAGDLKPLPQTVFPIEEAVHAFRYMQQAKHIGKIILTLPALEQATGQAPPRLTGITLSSQATYLITGGLGGLGLLAARWLVEQGAKHLLLVSRRSLTPAGQAQVQTLEALGAQITVAQADIADAPQVTNLMAQIKQAHPPLRGIIHAAGVLEDGILQQMSWAAFARVMAPKVRGAWLLHQATQTGDVAETLDFFVLFSSLTSLIGAAGQANYAGANAFLDALAHYRRARNLPALTINWGAWAGVGMAAERHLADYLRQRGLGMIPPTAGMQMMAQMMVQQPTQIGIAPVTWSRLRKTLPPHAPFFKDVLTNEGATATAPTPPKAVAVAWQKAWFAADAEERRRLLVELIREQIGKILGQREAQTVSRTTGFFELGMDSLATVELRNYLQTSTGLRLPNTLAFDYPTVDALVTFLFQKLTQLEGAPTEAICKTDSLNGVAATHPAAVHLPHPTNGAANGATNGTGEAIDDIAQRLAEQLGLT